MAGSDVNASNPGPGWRARLWRLARWALVIEAAWLIVVNGLLHLPLTQDLVNAIRPEKFRVRWDSAWTAYPFQVSLDGVFANGNSKRQMWQLEAARVEGFINPLPLLWKTVALHDVSGRDIDYRQRPRPRPDRDYSRIEAWFPPIEGREVTPADLSPFRTSRPWRIELDEVEASGRLEYWVYQLQGEARGRLAGELEYRTRGGPLRLDLAAVELELGRHVLNGDSVMFEQARTRGALGFDPFRPRETKGLDLLRPLYFDLDVDVDLERLAFLDLFLLDFEHLTVDGSGQVVGRLVYDRGVVRPGTDLAIAARNLKLGLMGHRIEGLGSVSLRMDERTAGQMALGFYYGDLRVLHEADGAELLTGQGLVLTVGGDGRVLPDPGERNTSLVIELEIGELDVPDFAVGQRYLPERWPFRLHGGRGVVRGSAWIRPTAYAVDLALESDEADLGLADYRFLANLNAGLKLANPSMTTGGARADGSYLRIDHARLQRDGDASGDPWSAGVELPGGRFDLVASRRTDEHDVIDLFHILSEEPMKDLLAGADGAFDFRGDVSDLAWLGVFFGGRYRARVGGSAVFDGAARLADGLPAPGTDVTIRSGDLLFNFLDYATRGRGEIRLQVDEGGGHDDWRVAVGLDGADLRRRGDGASFVRDVRLEATARFADVDLDPSTVPEDFGLTLRMPEARVTDVAVFNRYLPPDAPLALTGGGARLAADLVMQADDAQGWVRLDAEGVDLAIDDQDVRGDLRAEIAVVGGRPADMVFDVAGSRLRLENVGVSGAEAGFDDAGWFAELVLTRGDTVFVEPLVLGVDAELRASDSRPLVTLFRNQDGWRPEFIARALTVADISGNAKLEMADGRLRIPFAWLQGGTIEAGAKAELSGAGNRGVVYLKYGKLDAVLRIADGRRNLDILRARRTFDAYRVSDSD
jgi:hypothetical protein